MAIRSKWLMGFLFSFFLCYKNDELTLPVAKDSHLLNALQICLMDTSCQNLAVTCSNQKYFPFGFGYHIPTLLSQWETWKGWKRNMRLLKKPSKCREWKIILSRLILLSSKKKTARRTSKNLVCDAEPEGAASSLPSKQAKIAIKIPKRPLKKEEILTGICYKEG